MPIGMLVVAASCLVGASTAPQPMRPNEAQVVSRGVTELFLLTTCSAAFFEREGFARASRADAPSGIRGTAQFCTLCPATAVCMRKPLPARSNEVSTPP